MLVLLEAAFFFFLLSFLAAVLAFSFSFLPLPHLLFEELAVMEQ